MQGQKSQKPWTETQPPQSFLIIRMHAFGDVAITFPCCESLRKMYPDARIDYLTTEPTEPLAQSLEIFNNIISFPATSHRWDRVRAARIFRHHLTKSRYDVVLDLQNNWVSRSLRRAIRPKAWAEFDRQSPELAGVRAVRTLHRAGFQDISPLYKLSIRKILLENARKALVNAGWDQRSRIMVINPAGLWKSRQWPAENFADFIHLILEENTWQVLLIGTNRVIERMKAIPFHHREDLIDLVGGTSAAEALALLQYASLVVSEDSGLMHMSWVSGVPTIALFGSSRHDWSAPMGDHTYCFHSADLPCGDCMSPECRFGDNHCLTRVTPAMVYEKMQQLLGAGDGAL